MQKIAIIASSKDPAGVNIRNNLIELFDFKTLKNSNEFFGHQKSERFFSETNEKIDNNDVFQYSKIKNKIIRLYLINSDLIFAENVDKKISADIFIFASKHRSKENKSSFTVHPIGNWDKADFGGEEKKLCFSSAVLLKNLFVELNKNFNKYFENKKIELALEATHHGPYLEKPAVFVEIGSTEKEWNDKECGSLIAKTIMNGLEIKNDNYKISVGIGGKHYCLNFNKVILKTDIAVSHICPKYMLEKLDENLMQQSIEKTKEKVDFILLDWKGLGAEKQRILELLKNINLEVKRTDKVQKLI